VPRLPEDARPPVFTVEPSERTRRARRFLIFLLVSASVLAAVVFLPIASALITAAVLAVTLWPLHERLSRRLGRRRKLSAYVLTFAVLVLFALPVAPLSAFLVDEGSRGIEFVSSTLRSEGLQGLIDRLPGPVRTFTNDLLSVLPTQQTERLDETVSQKVTDSGRQAVAAVSGILSATGSLLFQFAMMMIAFFALLLQGREAVGWIESASPLPPSQTRELLVDFKMVSYALVVSTVLTCAVQAAAALVGYLIARVPHPLFFTALTFVIAFIPAIGAASVVQFAALLLFATGRSYAALFLSLWGFVVVALVDNIVKPLLIKNQISMPGALVFFALIGGLGAFGAVGLIIGPLAISLLITLVRMHQRSGVSV
jgi:predicted PurR-regulated permease PerM